jgi:hypothetical protein
MLDTTLNFAAALAGLIAAWREHLDCLCCSVGGPRDHRHYYGR